MGSRSWYKLFVYLSALWMVMALLYENPEELNIVNISVDVISGEENIAKVGRTLS